MPCRPRVRDAEGPGPPSKAGGSEPRSNLPIGRQARPEERGTRLLYIHYYVTITIILHPDGNWRECA